MNRIFIYSIAAVLCAACMPAQVFAFEVEYVEELVVQTEAARMLLKQDTEAVCSMNEERAFCQLQFKLADNGFYLVERALMMAAIAHEGEQREHWLKKAGRLYDKAWDLYGYVLAENILQGETFAREAAKAQAQ